MSERSEWVRVVLVSLGLFGCGGGAKDAPPPAEACLADPIRLEGDGSVASPPACMTSCMQDSDCTAVNTSCPGCCEFVPLSRSYEDHYENFKTEECRKYHGLVCGCKEKPSKTRCTDHVCVFE